MYFILPETKGISLERMDKLFGEVDAVEAGEQGQGLEKAEALARSYVEHREVVDEKGTEVLHVQSEKAV